MSDSAGVPVLIIAGSEDHATAINTAMRDAGHAAHCTRNMKPGDLVAKLQKSRPELILVFGTTDSPDLAHAVSNRDEHAVGTPVLLVADMVDQDTISRAMQAGANDVISLGHQERLQAVITRELRSSRLETQLAKVIGSAQQYEHELNSLKRAIGDATADIQEGIIVNANPAWLELFGLPENDELEGMPIMDFCAVNDRPTLKGGLVACQNGKWQEDMLEIRGINADSDEFPLAVTLENITHEGDPAIRMLVPADSGEEELPERMIEQALQRDPATGFFNRAHFINTVTKRLEKAPSGGVRAIAYVRPDRFSRSVDEVGLLGTEAIIVQFGQLLRDFTQPEDIFGRFGGTIFTVLLERGTMSDVEAWAEQLLTAVSENVFDHDDQSTAVTCTIGVCEADSAKTPAEKLLADAELACRTGRQQGGNRMQLSERSGDSKQVRQDDDIWVPKIRSALMENRLRLEHQPIGSLNKDISNSFDTLVRMKDDDGETILPGEFMPVAERTGLSKNIDRWVIGASISFCQEQSAELIFVHLSRDSLKDDSLPQWVQSQIEQAGIGPERICLQVSEELAHKHIRQTQKLAEALQKLRFRFAIEHFGTAKDSGRTLKLIPMDIVKIDGSLMQGLHKNPNVQAQVKELVRQAHEKGIITVAERVQDANTMAVLWQLSIDYIQGNYVQTQEIVIEDTSQSTVTTLALEINAEPGRQESGAEETPTDTPS